MILRKWTRLFYLCVLLGSFPVLAQKKPAAVVWTSGSVSSARALFSPETNTVVLSREDNERAERNAGYLPPDQRDALFRKVGIETRVSSMDEFEKDMLMMGARAYTVRELKSDYPMLTESQLSRLKREMRKVK